jgi:Protein of unknown function (DUF2380)
MKIQFVMVLVAALFGGATSAWSLPPVVMVTGVELINSSLQPVSDAERQRIVMIKAELIDLLTKSGRYQIVPVPDELQKKIDARPNIAGCGGCQYVWGRELGVDQVIWATVQKVSNLILNINVYMDDVKAEKPLFGTSVDIRSNTDESWLRGIRFLVRYNILKE